MHHSVILFYFLNPFLVIYYSSDKWLYVFITIYFISIYFLKERVKMLKFNLDANTIRKEINDLDAKRMMDINLKRYTAHCLILRNMPKYMWLKMNSLIPQVI